ncbi:hypothetical protein GIB67_014856 [Kingdonia uniflora]|uniref:Uncharacterized protein n=1 Tax=Kingdonia uniflora TaxID=39325 RepID=A0A7J7MTD1_9MAGN|nr:hypothetical protein GIB67_014856 [Kingdonia uniflora]
MEVTLKYFYAFLVVSLLATGLCDAQCSVSDIKVSQNTTGEIVKAQPEYEVTMSNNCICTQLNIEFNCTGFQSVETPNATFIKDGDTCVLNDGVYGFESLKFKYAWATPFDLTPTSSQIACSLRRED